MSMEIPVNPNGKRQLAPEDEASHHGDVLRPFKRRILGEVDGNRQKQQADRQIARAVIDAFAQDGIDKEAKPRTLDNKHVKNKLIANPNAPSAELLGKVATQAQLGPVLPTPNALPPTAKQAQAFARRIEMNGPPGAMLAASAGAVGTPAISQEQVRKILENPHGEQLSKEEASYVKEMTGKTPPASTLSALPATDDQDDLHQYVTAIDAADRGVSSKDSIDTILQRARTYVPWQNFYVSLSKRQQADLAMWLLQRQKLQLLSASVTIAMLETDKQLTINNIMIDHAMSFVSLIRAVEQSKNSITQGMMRPLKNSGLTVMPSASDLQSGVNQDNDAAPAQDLHRREFLRRAKGNTPVDAPTKNNLYQFGMGDLAANKKEATDSMRVPRTATSSPDDTVEVPRTLLSTHERAQLSKPLQDKYDEAIKDLEKQREYDFPATVGLFAHEAGLCRGAAARWGEVAQRAAKDSDAQIEALKHQKTWLDRGQDIENQGKPWQQRLQQRSSMLMEDENRYGDLLRERTALVHARSEVENKLRDAGPEQREHLERVRMNIDWRSIALDRELGRFSNPKADNRLKRWHTGAKNMADGFYLAHLKRQSDDPLAQLQWTTMSQVAPVGAEAVNSVYIRAIEKLASGEKNTQTLTAADFHDLPLSTIDRAQMMRHIDDRKAALNKSASDSDARLNDFHQKENKYRESLEQIFGSSKVFDSAPKSRNPLAMALRAAQPRVMHRAPVTFKDTHPELHQVTHADVPPASMVLDPQAAADFYRIKASAGAQVMAADRNDPRTAGYQNVAFERLNRVSDAAQYINFDGLDRATTEAAQGNTQDIIGESAQVLSEVYSAMAQERRMIFDAIKQIMDAVFQVPT